MTLNEAIEAKAIPEAHIVWYTLKNHEHKKYYACDDYSWSKFHHMKGSAKAFENMRDAEKRCLEVHDEILPELFIEAGVDTIRVV